MYREELQRRLAEMSDSEQRHKEDPDKGLQLYDSFRKVRNASGDPVYILEFDSHSLESKRDSKFLVNATNTFHMNQMTIRQHSRYSKIPVHIHNYVEINYVYSGHCRQLINGRLVNLREGDLCMLDTNVPHTILETTEEDIIINLIMLKPFFTMSFLSRLASTGIISNFIVNAISQIQNHNRHIIFHTGNEPSFKEAMENLMCESFDPSLCSKEIIESYMVIMFSKLLQTFQGSQAKEYGEDSSHGSLIEILKYLEDHYKDATLISTAERFSFHPNYLSAYLKKATGKNFKEMLQIQRLTSAALLLTNTSLTVNEVANEIGYNNLGFFYKKFVACFGQTPSEYRQKNR
ncbi:AraC family transcriptional regulator [Paenibacillus sp. S150]|uniref:AraC family transcriptional regulator n=1 Tax=Paenibacillus sp. S150 TaxID=2749826 RepID=UPI001C57045D|nr:AraC family transcriptional regulator [Paenibacillus sp. S150]MBW4082630.1 helix-turn-helix transcriptional regulator [Paenibacillus sp. S150]